MTHFKILPTDPAFKELVNNPLLFKWSVAEISKYEKDKWITFQKILGTHWDVDQFKKSKNSKPKDYLNIPLTVFLDPDKVKDIKQNLQRAEGKNLDNLKDPNISKLIKNDLENILKE